jgi:hypothetical protein
MSATAPDFPNMVSATPTASATPLKKRRGCGRFTSATGAIPLVFVAYVVLNPWALHIAGRCTRAMTWAWCQRAQIDQRRELWPVHRSELIPAAAKTGAPSPALTI